MKADKIELYLADMRRLPLAEEYEQMLRALPEEARSKAERFVKEKDRIRSATGALLMRSGAMLAGKERGEGGPYHIELGQYGKPFIREYPSIHFSLSHSGELIAYAYGQQEVGVDVEELADLDLSVFDPVLTHEEKKRITTAPNRLAEFYRIWTIREAFAKKDGRGLAVFEQEEIRIDYENNQIFFQDKVVMVRTFLWEGHVISLCAEHLPKEIRPQFITAEEWKQKWFFS